MVIFIMTNMITNMVTTTTMVIFNTIVITMVTTTIKGRTRSTTLQRSKGSLFCLWGQSNQCLARADALPYSLAQVILVMMLKMK